MTTKRRRYRCGRRRANYRYPRTRPASRDGAGFRSPPRTKRTHGRKPAELHFFARGSLLTPVNHHTLTGVVFSGYAFKEHRMPIHAWAYARGFLGEVVNH